MENYQLVIKAYDRPGTIERILRVIRHRGGYIKSLNMSVESNYCVLTCELVRSKTKALILNQLIKLADVISVV